MHKFVAGATRSRCTWGNVGGSPNEGVRSKLGMGQTRKSGTWTQCRHIKYWYYFDGCKEERWTLFILLHTSMCGCHKFLCCGRCLDCVRKFGNERTISWRFWTFYYLLLLLLFIYYIPAGKCMVASSSVAGRSWTVIAPTKTGMIRLWGINTAKQLSWSNVINLAIKNQ